MYATKQIIQVQLRY